MNRVAAIQMTSGMDVSVNLCEAARLIGTAARAGAKLVVLPENFACMSKADADRLTIAEDDGRGPIQDFLAEQARTHKIWVAGGTIPIKSRDGARARAACVLHDDRGMRVTRYDKIHLFDVRLPNGERYHESSATEPGEELTVVDTPFGKLGLAVCYDLRFPELFRGLLDDGVEIVALPSAFTSHTGRAHWDLLVRARAVENFVYMIAAAQWGTHANGRQTHGDSMIVNPWGDVLDRLPQGVGYAIAEIDRNEQTQLRSNLPAIEHRRLGK
ncbi:MAG TPA: carbon-nitrogen hydrolase family protein [Burkholderiales bacterium]|nr:carbon-nitrogen hydrolase family protein [Burkholderiales bacterium]